jgi:hypothetical protein
VKEDLASGEIARSRVGIKMKVSGLDNAEEVLVVGVDIRPYELI